MGADGLTVGEGVGEEVGSLTCGGPTSEPLFWAFIRKPKAETSIIAATANANMAFPSLP